MSDDQPTPLSRERVRADLDALVASSGGEPGFWVVTWEIIAPWRCGARWLQLGLEGQQPADGWLLNFPDPLAAVSDDLIAALGLAHTLVAPWQRQDEWCTLHVRADLRDAPRRAEAGDVMLEVARLVLQVEPHALATSRFEQL